MEYTITNDNFLTEVMQAKQPVLIDFWATWCGPCRMLAPVLEEIAQDYDGRVKVCKVNVDEETELADHFQVSSIPMLALLKNGKLVTSLVGYRPKEELEAERLGVIAHDALDRQRVLQMEMLLVKLLEKPEGILARNIAGSHMIASFFFPHFTSKSARLQEKFRPNVHGLLVDVFCRSRYTISEPLKKSAAALSGSLSQLILKIHKIFLRVPTLNLEQNPSLTALAIESEVPEKRQERSKP